MNLEPLGNQAIIASDRILIETWALNLKCKIGWAQCVVKGAYNSKRVLCNNDSDAQLLTLKVLICM